MTAWKTTPPPKDRRVLIRTENDVYAGIHGQNYMTGDIGFIVCNLDDGNRAIVPQSLVTAWAEIPE